MLIFALGNPCLTDEACQALLMIPASGVMTLAVAWMICGVRRLGAAWYVAAVGAGFSSFLLTLMLLFMLAPVEHPAFYQCSLGSAVAVTGAFCLAPNVPDWTDRALTYFDGVTPNCPRPASEQDDRGP
jgi:hypothetical protein